MWLQKALPTFDEPFIICFDLKDDRLSNLLNFNTTVSASLIHLQRMTPTWQPGAVARSEVSSLGMQAAPSLIPTSGTFFHGDFGHKNISTAILPLPLIQEEQLSVTGERMCTKYW